MEVRERARDTMRSRRGENIRDVWVEHDVCEFKGCYSEIVRWALHQ